MSTQIVPRIVIASAAIIALAGCSATDDYYAGQRIEAESNRTVASAQLASTQALSATVGSLTSQNAALTQTVIMQSSQVASAWAISAVVLGAGLAVALIVGGWVVVSTRRRESPTVVYYLPNTPTHDAPLMLDNSSEWPEQRAKRRAARLMPPQERYQLTERTGR